MPGWPAWARRAADELLLALHVQPGARRTRIVGEHGERLKLAVFRIAGESAFTPSRISADHDSYAGVAFFLLVYKHHGISS